MKELLERYRQDYNAAKQAEDAAIHRALLDHTSMPGNYWQDRWRAEQKLRAALAVAETLADLE